MLSMLGYDEFKLIDQRTHRTIDGYQPDKGRRGREVRREYVANIREVVEMAARRVPGASRACRAIFHMPPPAVEPVSRTRPFGASGPFAEDTDGEWRPIDEVAFDYLRLRSPENPSWYDFHARVSAEVEPRIQLGVDTHEFRHTRV
jgi:hypothetical protein